MVGNNVLVNQEKKNMDDLLVIELSQKLSFTKDEQICAWASYGNCSFLELAETSNQLVYVEAINGMALNDALFCPYQLRFDKWYYFKRLSKYLSIYCFNDLPEIAAVKGNMSVIVWCLGLNSVQGKLMFNRGWEERIGPKAASSKRYDLLEILVADNVGNARSNELICSEIAKNGDVVKLKYFNRRGCPFSEDIAMKAIQSGNLNVLKHVLKRGASYGKKTCAAAAEYGELSMLIMLKEQFSCEWNEKTIITALTKGHDHVAVWALLNGCPVSGKSCTTVVSIGNLETLKLFLNIGCPLEFETFNKLIRGGFPMDIIESCCNSGGLYYDDVIETAALQSNFLIFQFCVKKELGKPDMFDVYSNCLNNPNPEFLNWYKSTLSMLDIEIIEYYLEGEMDTFSRLGYRNNCL